MLEVNRALYTEQTTPQRKAEFATVKAHIGGLLELLRRYENKEGSAAKKRRPE